MPMSVVETILPLHGICEHAACKLGPWRERKAYLRHLRDVPDNPGITDKCEYDNCGLGPWLYLASYQLHVKQNHSNPEITKTCKYADCRMGPWNFRSTYFRHLEDVHASPRLYFCDLQLQEKPCTYAGGTIT